MASSDRALAPDPSSMAAAEGQHEAAAAPPEEEALAPADDAGEEEATGKNLERAAELFEKGSEAIEAGNFVEAVDFLSRALEIRVSHFGELAPECASSYYKYGCALLYKAQEEADPLGDVSRNAQKNSGSAVESASSKVSATGSSNKLESGEGSGNKDEENNEQNDDDEEEEEETGEADEEESDLDLSWKMLDVARAIMEKQPGDMIEKVNVLAALGEVSMEREDIETSLNDYLKALSILEHLVDPDNRRVIELNFRICLVLEVGSKIEEAIPYCQKAISLCNSRLERLTVEATNTKGSVSKISNLPDSSENGNKASCMSNGEEEIEVLSGILCELEKKLEDLQQVLTNPKAFISEVMKMIASRTTGTENSVDKDAKTSSSLSSSQIGIITGNFGSPSSSQMSAMTGNFDPPTVSTATASSGVTHLGVVGRGIKRAVVSSVTAPPPKKPLLDSSAKKAESSSASEVVNSIVHTSDAAS